MPIKTSAGATPRKRTMAIACSSAATGRALAQKERDLELLAELPGTRAENSRRLLWQEWAAHRLGGIPSSGILKR